VLADILLDNDIATENDDRLSSRDVRLDTSRAALDPVFYEIELERL
jgi:hypothetical protein